MKKNEKLFPNLTFEASFKSAPVKSKSNVRNNRVGNFENNVLYFPSSESERVVGVKSKSNVRNNRVINLEDGDIVVSTGDEQTVVVVKTKSKSNVRNN